MRLTMGVCFAVPGWTNAAGASRIEQTGEGFSGEGNPCAEHREAALHSWVWAERGLQLVTS